MFTKVAVSTVLFFLVESTIANAKFRSINDVYAGRGIGFSAPELSDYSTLPNPSIGDIVLDGSDSHFYGYNGSSWRQFDRDNLSSVRTITGTDTISLTEDIVLITAPSSSDFTVTLPSAVGNSGKVLTVKRTDSQTALVTIDGNSSETIDCKQCSFQQL